MKAHILTGNDNGDYLVVAHFAVPPSTNAAGKTWQSCLVDDGRNTTILTTAHTTQVELDAIAAGSVVEVQLNFNRLESGGGGDVSVNGILNKKLVEERKKLQRRYKYYGRTF